MFNLGHGVPPDTDPAVLQRIVDLVHEEGGDLRRAARGCDRRRSSWSAAGSRAWPQRGGCSLVGLSVILLEARRRLGGKIAGVRIGDLSVDGGAESVLVATPGGRRR